MRIKPAGSQKGIHRITDADGRLIRYSSRVAGMAWHSATGSTDGVPLLTEIMRGGQALLPPRSLQAIRHDCAQQLRALPHYLLELDGRPGGSASRSYPVIRSAAVEALAASAG